MTETGIAFGAGVSCTDEVCGTVDRIIVDPKSWTVTHIAVKPGPFERLEVVADGLRLCCTLAKFEQLDPAEATPRELVDNHSAILGPLPPVTRGQGWLAARDEELLGTGSTGIVTPSEGA